MCNSDRAILARANAEKDLEIALQQEDSYKVVKAMNEITRCQAWVERACAMESLNGK